MISVREELVFGDRLAGAISAAIGGPR